VIIIIGGFLTMYETDFWNPRKDLWQPIVSVGVIIFALNIISRFFRSKLNVELLKNSTDKIKISPIDKVLFSGWLQKPSFNVDKTHFKSLKSFYFSGSGSAPGIPGADGKHWVCFEFNDRSIIEYHLPDHEIVNNILKFVGANLPDIKVSTDENV
jgi:hypothetical protein